MRILFFVFFAFFPGVSLAQTCTSPDADVGTIIYNNAYSVFQGCTSEGWVAFHGQHPGTPNFGGFFVITREGWTGDLNGLSGANQKCLDDLTANDWKGKELVTLSASNVRAFLCDEDACNNLTPNSRYFFAQSGSPTRGGDSFTTDDQGRGPNDALPWSGIDGRWSFGTTWWSNRGTTDATKWSNTPASTSSNGTCRNWSDDWLVYNGISGRFWPDNTGSDRWNNGTNTCNYALRLICIVDAQ